ncbi:MAG: Gfo/Idh/MocA family protein [Cyclobacteriaceae bacterium]
MQDNQRRKFIKQMGAAASALIVAPTIIPASALGKNGHIAPSDRINLAFIGAGNQAGNDARGFLEDERVQITAICDVNKKSKGYWDGKVAGREYIMKMVDKAYSKNHGRKYQSTQGYTDFREVLELKDVDAVEIVTPDHWHAIPVLMAAAAKKDIYCQKPLALTVAEGRAMSNAVKKHKVVFQTGSQQRSNEHFRRICELVRNEKIGKLQSVECHLPGGTPDFGKTGDKTQTTKVPRGFDYDMWLGPAPEAPYCPARTHVNFRWIMDYSGGMVTDWGGHHPDIAQWGMDTEYTGPVKIRNAKAKWAQHPVWNTATEFYFECEYANGLVLTISSEPGPGVKFNGSEGSVWASRREHDADPKSLLDAQTGEDETHLYRSDNHYRNFIDCVISRKEPIAPCEVAHRSITLAHLGNIAMRLNQDLDWDPLNERVTNSEEANKMLARPMRAPWDKIYQQYVV